MASSTSQAKEGGKMESEPSPVPQNLRVKVPDYIPTLLPDRRIRSLEFKQFLCGVLAGGAAGACTAPLEGIRTRVIARKGADSTLQLLDRASKEEGVRKAVLSANLKMSVAVTGLSRGVQFYVYELVKRAAKRWPGHDPKVQPLPAGIPISSLAGAAGAFASTLLTYPLTAVSDHMSLQPGKYSGLRSAMVGITKEHGVTQLFRGITPKLCSMVPSGAISFYTYDTLKQQIEKKGKRKVTTIESLVIGSVAGLASLLMTYPLELARKEINMSLLPVTATPTGGYKAYSNLGQALVGIARGGGPKGLYMGVVASAMEVVPQTAISFMVYEAAKRVFVAEFQERLDEVKG